MAGIPRSPRLLRSKSGNPSISVPEYQPFMPNSGGRKSVDGLTSTTRTIINKDEKNRNPTIVSTSFNKKVQENRDKLIGGSQRYDATKIKRTRSTAVSPSAWALSPGRGSSLSSPVASPAMASPDSNRVKVKSSGMSGVLKYFRQKKVSPIQEEAFHRFRVLHTRLIQWRFLNARAESSMVTIKLVAEKKLFNVWLRTLRIQNLVVEKRIEMQKLKHEIKLLQIIKPVIYLLNEWAKIEKKYLEAVAKVARNLSALSIRVPLLRGAKADMVSFYKSICTAMAVMNSIEAIIATPLLQVEKTVLLLRELINTMKQEKECLEELRKTITMVASLEAWERSLRVSIIQAAAKEGVSNCL